MTQPQQKPGRSKQNYGTPENFIRAVKARLGVNEFAIDLAAEAANTKARVFFDVARDALSVPGWSDYTGRGWGWLNPEFRDIAPWAEKCVETKDEGGQVSFLVPAGVGSNWFRDHVDGKALVLLLNGRLAFDLDHPTWLYPKDCILCLYSPAIQPGYEVWNWRKQPPQSVAA